MASVLDFCRDIDPQRRGRYNIAIPDDAFAEFCTQIEKLKPKDRKKWKGYMQRSDASFQTVRFEEKGFYANYLNQRLRVIPASSYQRLREARPGKVHIQFEETLTMDFNSFYAFHDGQMAAAHTGNHRPRNHRIGVPTKAGEPVRG